MVRRSTERPESQDAGFAQFLAPERSIPSVANPLLHDTTLSARLEATPSPYGDGRAGVRIAQIARRLADGDTPEEAISSVANSRDLR